MPEPTQAQRAARKYPWFSCQFWCPVYTAERGLYCGEGCYAIDGFDLAGKTYPYPSSGASS